LYRHNLFYDLFSGYRVGFSLSERLSKENARYRDELDTVKYLCKELWICLFKKQVDNLRTNHQGVYVIHDGRFRLLQQTFLTMNKPFDMKDRLHTLYIAYSSGLIRGILTNMGYPCRVTTELADAGVRFQIEMNSPNVQK
jgi:trafficking protein particle complex subunit 6